jgi:hypothetical protein
MVPPREVTGGDFSRDDGLAGRRFCQAVIVMASTATEGKRAEGIGEVTKGAEAEGTKGMVEVTACNTVPAGCIGTATRQRTRRQEAEGEGSRGLTQERGEGGGDGERNREREEEGSQNTNSRERKA